MSDHCSFFVYEYPSVFLAAETRASKCFFLFFYSLIRNAILVLQPLFDM